ncbi:MAG: YdeI/OmpD-associated family protein [Candidatus Micrarchaeota archaeon]
MKIGKTLYVSDRKAWRAWLSKHHKSEREVWLVYYRMASGKPRISYNDAVEEALCFGWIDSIVKRLDDERFAQRFSPRRRGSALSQMNRERIRRLFAAGKMTKAGLDAVSHAFSHEPDHSESAVAADILAAIRKESDAWRNFWKLPESYRRIRIAYIESQRRHGRGAFLRSLGNFVRMTAKNKRFGMMQD